VADEQDIYVRYLAAGDTRMASVTKLPTQQRGGADGAFDVSYDGQEVALITSARLDPAASGDDTAYLARNLLGSVDISKVSQAQEPRSVAISGDGKLVAFADDRVWLADCATSCGTPDAVDSATPPTGDVSTFGVGFPAGSGAPSAMFWNTDRGLL